MRTLTGIVVDDEPPVRTLFARVLRRAGMQVFEAESAKVALALAQTTSPDFVVTDKEMPETDGIELCRRLRDEPAFKDLRIVVVSGSASQQAVDAIAAGCDAVLAKPCSSKTLLETIQRLLRTPL
jgi:two-component system, OmpR family, phosphate regulon response regulator PhoB